LTTFVQAGKHGRHAAIAASRTPPWLRRGPVPDERGERIVNDQPTVIEELLEFASGGSSVALGEIGFAPDVGRVNGAVLEWGRLAEFVGGDRFQSHHGIAGLLVAQSDGSADNREPVQLQGGVGGIGLLQFVGEGACMRDVASAGESDGGENFDIASRREAESCCQAPFMPLI